MITSCFVAVQCVSGNNNCSFHEAIICFFEEFVTLWMEVTSKDIVWLWSALYRIQFSFTKSYVLWLFLSIIILLFVGPNDQSSLHGLQKSNRCSFCTLFSWEFYFEVLALLIWWWHFFYFCICRWTLKVCQIGKRSRCSNSMFFTYSWYETPFKNLELHVSHGTSTLYICFHCSFLLRFNEYDGFSDFGISTGSWKTITRLLFLLKSKLKIHNVCLCCVKFSHSS